MRKADLSFCLSLPEWMTRTKNKNIPLNMVLPKSKVQELRISEILFKAARAATISRNQPAEGKPRFGPLLFAPGRPRYARHSFLSGPKWADLVQHPGGMSSGWEPVFC